MATPYQVSEYVRTRGTHCMHCGSEDLETGKTGFDAGIAWQEVSCNACGESWKDEYELVSTDVVPSMGDEKDAESLLGALGIEVNRLQDIQSVDIAGVSLYHVDAGASFPGLNIDDRVLPDYGIEYFEQDGGWDVIESLYDFDQKWIVLTSVSTKGGEPAQTVVMVAPYSDKNFHALVRHLMQVQIILPDACDRFPGLLQEVIDQAIDQTPERPWCVNCRKAL